MAQQLISDAQERAGDAAKRIRESVQEAVGTIDKRREVELKNLRARLRDVNTSIGGLERRYRQLEKRMTKQVETLSGRTVKASDLEKRLRTLEGELRRVARMVGGSSAARTAPARKPAARKVAARKPARKTAAKKPAARKPATRRRRTTARSATARRTA